MKILKVIKIIIVVGFLFISNNMFSQFSKGKIVYSAEFNINSTKSNNVRKKSKINVDNIIKRQDKSLYNLTFMETESLFQKEKVLKSDENRGLNLVAIFAGEGIFYTNLELKENLNQKEFIGELFLIENPLVDWTLTQETKQIGSYSCYKAKAIKYIETRKGDKKERVVTAWYTPQIPVNFGPNEYNGLPGLILELSEGNLTFSATKIVLNTESKVTIHKPKKGRKVTLEEYNKIVKKMSTDLTNRLGQ